MAERAIYTWKNNFVYVLCTTNSVRGSWGPHVLEGFYVGPALDHYISYNVWLPGTSSVRVFDFKKEDQAGIRPEVEESHPGVGHIFI
jgi:hypothetical protein